MPFTAESKLYGLFHQDKNYAKEVKEIRKNYPKAVTVLEIGAGTGLLTKELVKQGFVVTVIEPSEEMLSTWRMKGVRRINKKIEDVKSSSFKRGEFDLVLAMYDVLNYVHPDDIEFQLFKLFHWSKNVVTEMWDRDDGIKFFTHKAVGKWHRLRFAVKVGSTVLIWFIYFGKGFVVERHTIYLHG
jgi:SAM-dependent methyltransferase